jgi:hypothetical protein
MQIKALKVDKGAFCSKLASSGKIETHVSLQRKISVSEAGAHRTLFTCEI